MAGSPIKRARKKARTLAEADGAALAPAESVPGVVLLPAPFLAQPERLGPADEKARGESGGSPGNKSLEGEILPPEPAGDPTRTALKRAMRAKAQEYADEALERLAKAMRNPDDRIAVPAANAIMDRAHGKPTGEIEVGEGGLQVVILRFGDEQGN